MKTTTILIGVACLVTVACKPVVYSVSGDKEKLQGEWRVVLVDTGGYLPWLEAAAKEGRLVFAGDEAIFKNDHETRRAYRIDSDMNPSAIDMVGDQDEILKAIYVIEGDTLQICFGSDKRPTEFVAKPGQEGQALLILKRAKKP